MKILDTAGKTLKKTAAAVKRAVAPEAARPRDPFNFDDDRRTEMDGRGEWLGPRRRGWLNRRMS